MSSSDSDSGPAVSWAPPTLGEGPMTYQYALYKARKARATVASLAQINAPKCTPQYYLDLDRIERPEVYSREERNNNEDVPSGAGKKKRGGREDMRSKRSMTEQSEERSRKNLNSSDQTLSEPARNEGRSRKRHDHSDQTLSGPAPNVGKSRKHRNRSDQTLSKPAPNEERSRTRRKRSYQTMSGPAPKASDDIVAEPDPYQTLSEPIPAAYNRIGAGLEPYRTLSEPDNAPTHRNRSDQTMSEAVPEATGDIVAQPETDQTLSEPIPAQPETDQTLSKPVLAGPAPTHKNRSDQTMSEAGEEQTQSQDDLKVGVDQTLSDGVRPFKKDVVNVDELQYDSEVEEVNNHIDSSFVEYLVTVRLDQIALPDVAPGFIGEHLQYVSTLLKRGYEHTRGLIVVYAHPKNFKKWSKKDKITDLATRSDIQDMFQVVDGVYRTLYLEKELSPSTKLVVAVVQRQDNRPLSAEDLFTFGIRKNALSAQRKKPSTAHNVKVSNSVARTLERQLTMKVQGKSVYWLQKKIMEVVNKSSFHKLNSIRGYAELAHTCCGRPDIQELIERVTCVTPQIGISHLVLNEPITRDRCVLEIYLLSLRKALVPELIGPERFDSRNLVDSEDLHGARLADFVHFKEEVFKDIRKLCRIFRVSGGDGDTGIGLQACDILNMSIDTRYEVMDDNGVTSEKDFDYLLKDLITDQVSKWFSERITDRVSSVCKVCEEFIDKQYPEELSTIQETRRNMARRFEQFRLKAKKRDQGSKKKQKKKPDPPTPSSPENYTESDLQSGQNNCGQEEDEDDDLAKKKKELETKLAAVRLAKCRYLQGDNPQTVSDPTQIHPTAMTEEDAESRIHQTESGLYQTESGAHQSQSLALQTMSGAHMLPPRALQTQSGAHQSQSKAPQTQSGEPGSSAGHPRKHQTLSAQSMDDGVSSSAICGTGDLSEEIMEEFTLYDEEIPEEDPFGCLPPERRNLQESRMDDDANESLKLGYHCKLWKTDGVQSISLAALLRSVYLKNNHQASLWLTHRKLLSMHQDLHDHFVQQGRRFGDGTVPLDSVCSTDGVNSLTETTRLREQLNAKGWCAVECCEFIKDAMKTLETIYDNAPATINGEVVWEIIRNRKKEKMIDLTRRGRGRKQTSKVGVMELLEHRSEAWKLRAMIDVYIGLIARALKLGMKNGEPFELHMPSTGGRWLGTDEGTDVQDIHCDVTVLLQDFGIVPECAGYFAMVSGSKGFFIWVAERSHILQQCAHYKNNPVVVKKIYIPPFSFFFGRGDVFHAGDAYDPVYAQTSIRYHVLLTPKGETVGNKIEYGPDNVKWIDP